MRVKATFFLSFLLMNSTNYSYMLKNDTENYLIKYRQIANNGENIEELVLLKETCKPFAWVFPNEKPEIEVSFQHNTEILQQEKFRFNLDTIIETRGILLRKVANNQVFMLKARTVIHGPTRVLQFYENLEKKKVEGIQRNFANLSMISRKKLKENNDKNDKNDLKNPNKNSEENGDKTQKNDGQNGGIREEIKEKMKLMVLLNFREIGISLIVRNSAKTLVEMSFLQILGFEFLLLEEKTFKSFQIRMKYLNIDNNSDYRTLIPVVFTPTLKNSILKSTKSFFFDACVKYNHNSKEVRFLIFLPYFFPF